MICPKCGDKRWAVIDTRGSESVASTSSAAFNRASEAVSWYTSEFQARKRRCSKCGEKALTVEITLEDLHVMASLIAEGDEEAIRNMATRRVEAKKLSPK